VKTAIDVLCVLYSWLNRLYPPGFRAAFGEEMQAVFAAAATEAASRGLAALLVLWLRELRDWPGAVLSAYWACALRVHAQVTRQEGTSMGKVWNSTESSRPWAIEGRGRAMLAALPPLVIGLGIGVAATIDGGTWFDMKVWEKALLMLLTVLPVGILGVGGLIALFRSIPEWSYAWAGGTCVAGTVLLKIIAEERAEVGLSIVSPAIDVGLALALVAAGSVVLVIAALRGWAQAGLTSIGCVSVFGISTFSLLRAAPFLRHDLVLLAAPLGLLQAVLTYVYVRGGRSQAMRWAVMALIWWLNAAPMLLAHQVWQTWLAQRGRTSPILPLLVIVTILAWAGPVAGLLGRSIRRSLGRA